MIRNGSHRRAIGDCRASYRQTIRAYPHAGGSDRAIVVPFVRYVEALHAQRPELIVTVMLGELVGAELLVFGTGRVVGELGVSETVFGLLVIAAAVSFEEFVLEALPAFRGFPELSVGNALGTLVFLLTGSLGVIALVHPIEVPGSVIDYHLPALALTVLLAGGLLARGRLGRPEGALLITAYAAYVTGALL